MVLPPFLLVALALGFLSAFPGVARAEEASQYRSLIASALDEYELGNYEEARSLFERAHAIEPSARTLRGMGMAAYQARKYVIAIGYLEAALVDQHKPLTPQFQREVQSALDAARGFVVPFELVVSPPTARVMVDGEPIGERFGSLQLDPGEHEIVAIAPGYKTDSRRIKASSGRPGRVQLELTRDVPPPPSEQTVPNVPAANAISSPTSARGTHVPVGLKVLAGTGLSFALAGAVVGTVAGLKALSAENKLDKACPDKTCGSDEAAKLHDAKAWGTISTVALAVGGAGLAAGVVGLVLWIQKRRHAPETRNQARLTPFMLAPGLGVHGRF